MVSIAIAEALPEIEESLAASSEASTASEASSSELAIDNGPKGINTDGIKLDSSEPAEITKKQGIPQYVNTNVKTGFNLSDTIKSVANKAQENPFLTMMAMQQLNTSSDSTPKFQNANPTQSYIDNPNILSGNKDNFYENLLTKIN